MNKLTKTQKGIALAVITLVVLWEALFTDGFALKNAQDLRFSHGIMLGMCISAWLAFLFYKVPARVKDK